MQSGALYEIAVTPPASDTIPVTRYRINGAYPSFGTRLAIWLPSNVTAGKAAAVAPANPVCVIDRNHSAARSPSPGSGNCCSNDQLSTFW